MNVYLEYVVADNFVLDTLLLWAAAVTLRLPFKKWRLALGGAVGAACAVVSVYASGLWLFLLKTGCLAAMCLVAAGWGKRFFWYVLLTLAYTFVAGGCIVALFGLFKVSYLDSGGQFYEMRVPLFVYVLAVFFVGFLCYAIALYVRQTKKTSRNLVSVVVTLNKSHKLTGFCDSGNSLTFEGVPVCFVTKRFAGFSDYFAQQLLAKKSVVVPVTTVAGRVNVKAVRAKVTACGKECDVYLALPAEKCNTCYNVLLNSEFCGG